MTRLDSMQESSYTDGGLWHKSAPEGVRRAYGRSDQEQGWLRWREYLANRTSPVLPHELSACDQNALLWGTGESTVDADARRLLLTLGNGLHRQSPWSERAEAWIERTAAEPLDVARGLEAIAWARVLPPASATLPSSLWWKLLDHLRGLAREACESPLEKRPLLQQLLGGELPLTLAYLFPEIAPCRKAAKPARKTLSAGMLELIDGEGLPNSRILDAFRPLLACWTRCRILGERLEKGCSSATAGMQYEWAVRAALRLARPDGSQALCEADGQTDDSDLLAAALACGGDENDKAMASLALPGRAPLKGIDADRLPLPADNSSWAAVAVLQPGWGHDEPKLALSYEKPDFRMELSQQAELLLGGNWTPEVRLGGELLEPESTWQEMCWVSDKDVDYLELQIELSRGARIQRHIAMARKDRFLFLADAILDGPDESIEYCGSFSLAPDAGLAPAEETHEAFLLGRKAAALVLPLALPEWRTEHSPGRLVSTGEVIELQLSGQGGALFAPLFFDLKPRRMTQPATWRRLTVAADRRIVPPNVAAGYRVMVGKSQWLIYRSLAAPANRTLLGHNLSTELLIARFDRTGEVESLIEIEGE